jgi:hypothetical protein
MTENEIIKAGFSRVDISAEESGDLPYSYYHLEFGAEFSLCLMANEKGCEFVVTFLDYDHFEIFEYSELIKLIKILNRNLKKQ